jgi:hypothetical protein
VGDNGSACRGMPYVDTGIPGDEPCSVFRWHDGDGLFSSKDISFPLVVCAVSCLPTLQSGHVADCSVQ